MSNRSNRFVPGAKAVQRKDTLLRRRICICILIFSVIIPFINDGILYVLYAYIDNDRMLSFFNYTLLYGMALLKYAVCPFFSFSSAAAGIIHFGYKNFKTPVLLIFAGSFVDIMVATLGSQVYCYEHYLISSGALEVAEYILNCVFLFVFETVKNTVLLILCCRFAKKIRTSSRYETPDERAREKISGLTSYVKSVFNKKNPFLKLGLFCFGFNLIYYIAYFFINNTLNYIVTYDSAVAAAPVSSIPLLYLMIFICCVIGFLIFMFYSFRLSLKKASPVL